VAAEQPSGPVGRPPALAVVAGLCLAVSILLPHSLAAGLVFVCLGLCVASYMRREQWRWTAIVIAVLAVGVLALTLIPIRTYADPGNVTYAVTGSARSAQIMWHDGAGNPDTTVADLPWSKTISTASGVYVSMNARNNSGGGTVTCTISSHGQVVNTNTAVSADTNAICYGDSPAAAP